MAKSDRLLQAVLEQPDDASVLTVYADALQTRGDPRGALITLQQQRLKAADERRRRLLKLQEQQLLAEHRAELLGPLAAYDKLAVAWRLGFVRELHLTCVREQLDALVEALQLPAFSLLERLDVRLVRPDDVEPLLQVLPSSLWHLGLSSPDLQWEPLLEAARPVRSLELWGGPDVDFEGLELRVLERLRLTVGFTNLTREVAPRLELLTLGDGEQTPQVEELPEGLRLFRLLGESWNDMPAADASRSIHEWDAGRTHWEAEAGMCAVSRGGWGVAGERALLLTFATAPQLDDAFDEVEHLLGAGYELRSVAVPVGPLTLLAVELRIPQPRKILLPNFLPALGRRALTLEVAASSSNGDMLLRAWRGEQPVPLAMGPYRTREDVWRAGIDHALGFDPGRTFDLVCEALDAELPRRAHGNAAQTLRGEWPCATPLEPTDDPREYDEYDDPYELDEPLPDWWSEQLPAEEEHLEQTPHVDAPPQPVLVEVEAPAEQEEPEARDEYEAEPEERGDPEWTEVMAETPVELEEDGLERNPEEGLEPEALDVDGMHVEPDGVCFRCDRDGLRLERCAHCGHDVCEHCSVMRSQELRCRVCA